MRSREGKPLWVALAGLSGNCGARSGALESLTSWLRRARLSRVACVEMGGTVAPGAAGHTVVGPQLTELGYGAAPGPPRQSSRPAARKVQELPRPSSRATSASRRSFTSLTE